jgi:hypothetical protein
MSDDTRDAADEARRLYRKVLESVGEGALADQENIGVSDAFRIAKKLDVSIVETPHEWLFNYSVRDVERLGKLERDDWQKVMSEWRIWHREYAALPPSGVIAWIVSAVGAWLLLYRADGVLAIATAYDVQVRHWMLTSVAYVLLLEVAVFLPRVVGTIFTSDHWDTYSAGYSEGLRQGINRALMITPEREREMWEEISKADLAQLHLERPLSRDCDSNHPAQQSADRG